MNHHNHSINNLVDIEKKARLAMAEFGESYITAVEEGLCKE